ncbi:hypothetical protein GH733_016248 [Mirounga leonina]|nr:hypothetical protein GH733_016248 [Mirounga leonina]
MFDLTPLVQTLVDSDEKESQQVQTFHVSRVSQTQGCWRHRKPVFSKKVENLCRNKRIFATKDVKDSFALPGNLNPSSCQKQNVDKRGGCGWSIKHVALYTIIPAPHPSLPGLPATCGTGNNNLDFLD